MIIPLFRVQESHLARLKESLSHLIEVPFEFEVVFVVNDGNEGRYRTAFSNCTFTFRIITCARSGSYSSRNVGVKACSSSFLFFLDADIFFNKDDSLRLVEKFIQTSSHEIVCPSIIQYAEVETIWSSYDKLTGLPQARYFDNGWLTTAAMLISRSNFQKIGGFANFIQSGGDFEFCRRAVKSGITLNLIREVTFFHHARNTYKSIYEKNVRVAAGVASNPAIPVPLKILRMGPPFWQLFKIYNDAKAHRSDLVFVAFLLWFIRLYSFVICLIRGGRRA